MRAGAVGGGLVLLVLGTVLLLGGEAAWGAGAAAPLGLLALGILAVLAGVALVLHGAATPPHRDATLRLPVAGRESTVPREGRRRG